MRVGFYHAARGDESLARTRLAVMLQSVRRAMPGIEVTHYTDLTTAAADGADYVNRRNALPLGLASVDACASVAGEWLWIDTDVVVQADVRHVFDQPFDVAVADRRGTVRNRDLGTKCLKVMPFNKGVVFSRSRPFWQAVLKRMESLSGKRQGWMGDQQAMCDVIAAGAFDVVVLESRYNYPPHREDEDVSGQAITHYKGKSRKPWMLDRYLVGAA